MESCPQKDGGQFYWALWDLLGGDKEQSLLKFIIIFFLAAIWLSHGQRLVILEGTAPLTRS